MEQIVDIVKSLDPVSQGAVAFVGVLGLCAAKLFPDGTPVRVKLVVFFTLVSFAGGGLVYTGYNWRNQLNKADPHETAGAPHPPAVTVGSVLEGLSPIGVAHAADTDGWIFVGKYDRDSARWVEGPTLVLPNPARLPEAGQQVSAQGTTALYGDQPRYSIFTQSFKLADKRSEVEAGRRLVIAGEPVLLGQNVWCPVRLP